MHSYMPSSLRRSSGDWRNSPAKRFLEQENEKDEVLLIYLSLGGCRFVAKVEWIYIACKRGSCLEQGP